MFPSLAIFTSFIVGSLAGPVPIDSLISGDNLLKDLVERQDGASTTCPDPLNTPWNTTTYDCPHKNTLDSDGACSSDLELTDKTIDTCSSYCEVNNLWFPGPESPFLNSACTAGDSCTLSVGNSTTVTNSWSINLGLTGNSGKVTAAELTGSFNIGASYTYSTSVTYTVTETHTRADNATSDCGYFTFVPYYLSSCGTMTIGPYEEVAFVGGYDMQCTTDNLASTGNYCNQSPYTINGQAQGQVIWVETNCDGGGLADMSQQQPIYQYPGVSAGQVPSDVGS